MTRIRGTRRFQLGIKILGEPRVVPRIVEPERRSRDTGGISFGDNHPFARSPIPSPADPIILINRESIARLSPRAGSSGF